MKKILLITLLVICPILPSFADELTKATGNIGNVWIEQNHVFFTVCNGENNDRCHGFYLNQDHKLFQTAYTAIMNAKAMKSNVEIFGDKSFDSRTNFVKMLIP